MKKRVGCNGRSQKLKLCSVSKVLKLIKKKKKKKKKNWGGGGGGGGCTIKLYKLRIQNITLLYNYNIIYNYSVNITFINEIKTNNAHSSFIIL